MISVYFTELWVKLTRVLQKEEGQGLTEYALILFLVAIAAILALTLLGGNIKNVLSSVANAI
jgi:pilus assembly protein Flp/PilA